MTFSTLFLHFLLTACAAPAGAHRVPAAPVAALAFTGQVLSEQGQPLAGVMVKPQDGAGSPSITNADGKFLLNLEAAEAVLTFSCPGYRSQTATVRARQAFTLTLYKATSATDALSTNAGATAVVVPDVQPTFPGGAAAYRAYMLKNATYPAEANGEAGAVRVSFWVDEQGRILDAEVVTSTLPAFEPEALRLVRLMPWWNPALLDGKPVRVRCSLKLQFAFKPAENEEPKQETGVKSPIAP